VRVQRGQSADTPEEAEQVARKLLKEGAKELVIKAQILAGGRGKGHFNTGYKGGVHVCKTPEQVKEHAKQMLGNYLITKQTGPEGQHVKKVLVHESLNFDTELYFAILMDRAFDGPVIVASKRGGMDIEQVAEESPQDIFTQAIDIRAGIQDSHTERIGKLLGLQGKVLQDAQDQMKRLYKLMLATDSVQIEINPFVVASDGKVYCVDAKLNFDENAQFRQEKIFNMRDWSMEDPREVAAAKFNLNYIGLDGNIGCMVNGAGLAMATMDIIKLHGGQPANFLDVGGGASAKQVEEAFKILSSDKSVKAILVNIFGGIMKCDVIADGIVAAAKAVGIRLPLVVRLEGTNVEKGNKILRESGIRLTTASDLDDAAMKAVKSIS
jgi:succinyl-CoA synthetase beta subunit